VGAALGAVGVTVGRLKVGRRDGCKDGANVGVLGLAEGFCVGLVGEIVVGLVVDLNIGEKVGASACSCSKLRTV